MWPEDKLPKPKVVPPLDESFRPGVLANHAFLEEARSSGQAVPLVLGLERGSGLISVYRTEVLDPSADGAELNLPYVERLVKTLLWARGGWKVYVGGPSQIGEWLQRCYSPEGLRAFDEDFMGGVYEHKFTVEAMAPEQVPEEREQTVAIGRHLDGCRIGFDAGASDRKVAAVIEGESVFEEEVVWHPRTQSDPNYHYHHIMSALHMAAAHMPRVDAIGVSAAGIYIDNRVRVASLFRGVPKERFDPEVTDLFLRIRDAWGVPLEVANDGDVTALAGSMNLNANGVLGIALGSSEAGGYVTMDGNITGWLNELAFVPVDFSPRAPVDEWSGDIGCGVQYFSQEAVIRLAPKVGIQLDPNLTPAEKLKVVQDLHAAGDERARLIFETIGVYMGYGIAYYADLYDINYVLILGRVTSGEGGHVILERAQEVLKTEFPELAAKITLALPDEMARRVGQAVAAASLPAIGECDK
ncbi:MAG: ROK family protein [Armatimonadetes bacterium]|nr:ROK family protein [Armatimonadota bacterium]